MYCYSIKNVVYMNMRGKQPYEKNLSGSGNEQWNGAYGQNITYFRGA